MCSRLFHTFSCVLSKTENITSTGVKEVIADVKFQASSINLH